MSGDLDFEELDAAVNELIQQEKASEEIEKKLQNSGKNPTFSSKNFAQKSPPRTFNAKKPKMSEQTEFVQQKSPKSQASTPPNSPRMMDFAPRKISQSKMQNSPFFAQKTASNSEENHFAQPAMKKNSMQKIPSGRGRFMDMVAPSGDASLIKKPDWAKRQNSAQNYSGGEKVLSDVISPTHSTPKAANYSGQNSKQATSAISHTTDANLSEDSAKPSASEVDFAREIARAFEASVQKITAPNLDAEEDFDEIANAEIDELSDQAARETSETSAKKDNDFDDLAQKTEASTSPFLENVVVKKMPLGSMPPTALPADEGGRGEVAPEIAANNNPEEKIAVDVEITTLEDLNADDVAEEAEKAPEKLTESEFINEFLANIKAKTDEINAVAEEILRESESENSPENSADGEKLLELMATDEENLPNNSQTKMDAAENPENNNSESKSAEKMSRKEAKKLRKIAKQRAKMMRKNLRGESADHLPQKNHANQWPKQQNFAAVTSVSRSEHFRGKMPISAPVAANIAQKAAQHPAKLHKGWRIFGWTILYLLLIAAGGAVGILIYLNGWI